MWKESKMETFSKIILDCKLYVSASALIADSAPITDSRRTARKLLLYVQKLCTEIPRE